MSEFKVNAFFANRKPPATSLQSLTGGIFCTLFVPTPNLHAKIFWIPDHIVVFSLYAKYRKVSQKMVKY